MGFATLITGPSVEPIDVPGIKPHLRIVSGDTTFDAMLPGLISAARVALEDRTQRALLSQTWRYKTSGFPCDGSIIVSGVSRRVPGTIALPRPKLISIESVKYIDVDGAEQTLDPSVYAFDKDSEPAIVYLKPSQTWPTDAALGLPGAVSIDYTAGYGAAAESVPANLVQWIIGLVAYWFENPKSADMQPGLTASVPAQFLSELISGAIVHHVEGSR